MIEAVLNNKSQGYEYKEDILTSTVFGTLKYLDSSRVLVPFIESAYLYDNERTTLWEKLKLEGIELRYYQDVEYIFWSPNDIYGEPDLVLIFKNHAHNLEDFFLIIEAKFKSKKSGTGDKDQLARYFEAINNNLEGFNHSSISEFKGKKGYIIYLTELEAFSEIQDSLNILRQSYSDIDDRVFHLRWHQLLELLDNMKVYNSLIEKNIVEDLVKFVDKLGLRSFYGFSEPTISYKSELSKDIPIFFKY